MESFKPKKIWNWTIEINSTKIRALHDIFVMYEPLAKEGDEAIVISILAFGRDGARIRVRFPTGETDLFPDEYAVIT